MFLNRVKRHHAVLMVFCVTAMLFLAGCSKGPRRVPAGGTIEVDGKPLEGGILSFNPDVEKGNTARVSCTSPVRNGRFQIQTAGIERSESGPGVPLGWYKVSVRVNMPGEKPIFPGQPAIDIDRAYLNAPKSPLSIEVVDAARRGGGHGPGN